LLPVVFDEEHDELINDGGHEFNDVNNSGHEYADVNTFLPRRIN
jgi:hypothetical protein